MTEILVPAKRTERGQVASWLLATADDKKIDRTLIRAVKLGYMVPAELLDEKMSPAELLETKIEPYDPGPDNVTATPPAADPDRETIRAWAKANGYEVADKGQLKRSIYDAYVFAHADLS